MCGGRIQLTTGKGTAISQVCNPNQISMSFTLTLSNDGVVKTVCISILKKNKGKTTFSFKIWSVDCTRQRCNWPMLQALESEGLRGLNVNWGSRRGLKGGPWPGQKGCKTNGRVFTTLCCHVMPFCCVCVCVVGGMDIAKSKCIVAWMWMWLQMTITPQGLPFNSKTRVQKKLLHCKWSPCHLAPNVVI